MKKCILILSGPTHEYIDPVRYIGNASSGRMGKALAEEAVARGCEVEFITGPVPEVNLPSAGTIRIHHVSSADEMLSRAQELFAAADVIIFAAAVADYKPINRLPQKMVKSTEEITLRLGPTPDIARTLCAEKEARQIAIGFALQTNDGQLHARRKLENKKLDGIVLNTPETLGAEKGEFSFLSRLETEFDHWGYLSKSDCAEHILEAIDHLTA